MLVEAIDPGKNLGLEGINGCRSILRYLTDLGNRAAANRLAELEQMCAHLAPTQSAEDTTATSNTPTAIGTLTQPFSFATVHGSSVSGQRAPSNAQRQSTIDPSLQQLGDTEIANDFQASADFIGTDLANLPLNDIDSLYFTYHPPGLSFTGVEQADWETLENELFQGM